MTALSVAILGVTGLLAAGGSVWMTGKDVRDAPQPVALVVSSASGQTSATGPGRPHVELAQSTTPPAQQTLPGGASSLSESYQDWQVSCGIVNKLRNCALSQMQVQQNTGQRVLSLELKAADDGSVTGTLVMPFGLVLNTGVTLQVDDKAAGKALRFRACFPEGCTVPLSFDVATVASLREGSTLKIKAQANDGSDVELTVSLKGFGPALDRVTALGRS